MLSASWRSCCKNCITVKNYPSTQSYVPLFLFPAGNCSECIQLTGSSSNSESQNLFPREPNLRDRCDPWKETLKCGLRTRESESRLALMRTSSPAEARQQYSPTHSTVLLQNCYRATGRFSLLVNCVGRSEEYMMGVMSQIFLQFWEVFTAKIKEADGLAGRYQGIEGKEWKAWSV